MSRVWFHLITSTYGSWLPGDPRGFRTWHHKEHVAGDYNSPPPPDRYMDRHHHARKLMKHAEVLLPAELRRVAGEALRDELHRLEGRVLILSVSARHAHIQVQLDDGDARIPLGTAKLHSWFVLRDRGWTRKLWAKRCKVIRIRDRQHQRNVYRYIRAHHNEGAWVWSELESGECAEGV